MKLMQRRLAPKSNARGKHRTPPKTWFLLFIVLGAAGVIIYFMISKNVEEKNINIPKSTISFSLSKPYPGKESDTLKIKTCVINKENEVINSLYWDIKTSGFAIYEIDSLNPNHLNPRGFYRQAILETDQTDIRYGIIILPKNTPEGKYIIRATCSYYAGDINKTKEFQEAIETPVNATLMSCPAYSSVIYIMIQGSKLYGKAPLPPCPIGQHGMTSAWEWTIDKAVLCFIMLYSIGKAGFIRTLGKEIL